MVNGFINLNKPSGITSNKALGILKHVFKTQNIDLKVGHMGTLDPLATGVLPIALGRATRLFDYSLDKIKVYEAEFLFGAESDSLDIDTEITFHDIEEIDVDRLNDAIKSQIGVIEQIPPMYSAKSINGIRAYKLARQGINLDLKPKKIHIYNITLIEKTGKNKFKMQIECGAGTYIRSLGRDIAEKLGTTAVMCSLIRTKSGVFDLTSCVDLKSLEENPCDILNKVIPIERFLEVFPLTDITTDEKQKLLNGIRIPINPTIDGFCAVRCNGDYIGIGKNDDNGNFYIKTWLL